VARSSQTQTAILGALTVEPMTAYALREAIRDVLGHFWSESFGQIYPTLRILEDAGHVERRDGARAQSSVFAITNTGRAHLLDLLLEPPQESPPRNGLLLRLFFGRILGPARCRDLLRDARATAERHLTEYEQLLDHLAATEGHKTDWPYMRITILAGIHHTRAAVAWAEAALADLDTAEEGQPTS
jgi:DNA-binding PadR family transcriptional regulator